MQHDFQHYAIQMQLICHFDVFDVDTSSMSVCCRINTIVNRQNLLSLNVI